MFFSSQPGSLFVSDPHKFSVHMPAEHGNSLNPKGHHPDTKPGQLLCECVCVCVCSMCVGGGVGVDYKKYDNTNTGNVVCLTLSLRVKRKT